MNTSLIRSGGGRHVTIVSASVGAGHDGAADELARRLRAAGFSVDRHDFLDLLPASLGRLLRQTYAVQLRAAPESWERLFTALDRRRNLAAAVRALSGLAARRIARTAAPESAAIVSTYPLASQALGRLRRRGVLRAPVVTYLTDLSVHPLWVADGVDVHLALHPLTAAEAHRLGAADVRVCAPAVRPGFRPPSSVIERQMARLHFGLPDGERLALITAGSWGSGDVAATVSDVAATGLVTPLVVCGRNTALREKLARSGTGIALGWVDDMPALMRACDVVVQNAGGLSSLEARASGLPVLSYRCLPGHGRANAAVLEEAGWAPWARHADRLPEALFTALTGPRTVGGAVAADPAAIVTALAAGRSATVTAGRAPADAPELAVVAEASR
ncbi:MGDG synthase family glycosyltransferase [Actinoallomurus rhizosphaericola]|uniref:MGDG synthase family glycosyltransferase n=1 Tax=Actinoallomurus rhizosphaericola TaxID=2952536 RepID=UPI00209280C2|nr:glycosyltransferase [Actinoallomurus rhizosphaericola]MCO5998626.1 glycosyltransferase [Actinoallomurus rhizosphaericola]